MKVSVFGDYLIIRQRDGRFTSVDVSDISSPSPDKDWVDEEIKKNKIWNRLLSRFK